MADPYKHVVSFALDHPWALTAAMRATVAEVIARKIAGKSLTAEELAARLPDRAKLPQPEKGGAVAVIPIHGVIVPRGNMLTDVSGATSLDALSGQLREAMGTESVKSIVLDVDSPGGSVAGATEFAREVMQARTKKPIVAVAQFTMASAAYWIAAAATEIVASPSAKVGSIGVYSIHDDLSKALAEVGIKRTYVFAGKHKIDGNEVTPLEGEALATIQKAVDEAYSRFVFDVSRGRGAQIDAIRSGYGEGRTVGADEALALGMVDRIATFDDTVARLLVGAPQQNGRQAAKNSDQPVEATSQEPLPATDQERRLAAARAEARAFDAAMFEALLS